MVEEIANFEFKLEAFHKRGNLWLKWHSNASWRAQQGQIHVYENGQFPENPQEETKVWNWDDMPGREWDTGLRWGEKWYCAWIAEKWKPAPDPLYRYVVQLITKVD